MERKVTINLSEEFREVNTLSHDKELSEAIGYLSTWAFGSERYRDVYIVSERDNTLSAAYKNADGQITYSILAIKREDGSYSYHS